MKQPNLLRVWLYRGWCWSCRIGRFHSVFPCRTGSGFVTPGEAADAARLHAAIVHREQMP